MLEAIDYAALQLDNLKMEGDYGLPDRLDNLIMAAAFILREADEILKELDIAVQSGQADTDTEVS